MSSPTQTADELRGKRCLPCEGGVPKMTPDEVAAQMSAVPGWEANEDATLIRREWTVKHFAEGLAFLNRIGEVAEEDNHHPDLHLVGYRKVIVELTTHAIDGLSENDFILAAKIDAVREDG